LIRSAHRKFPIERLDPGEATLVDERTLSDAFERGTEYGAVSVQRGVAMLVTPTCDIGSVDTLTVWPLKPVAGSGLNSGNLEAGRYVNLYRIPDHEYFDPVFIDLTDIRPVRAEHFLLKDRIASITREAGDEILQKYHRSLGRTWGYSPGEVIEPLGKYQTGAFRCAQCNLYDLQAPIVHLKPGMQAPECENCKKIGKTAQWYPLTLHRKS
jgi:hypothetical protein